MELVIGDWELGLSSAFHFYPVISIQNHSQFYIRKYKYLIPNSLTALPALLHYYIRLPSSRYKIR